MRCLMTIQQDLYGRKSHGIGKARFQADVMGTVAQTKRVRLYRGERVW